MERILTVPLEEAQQRLPELIAAAGRGVKVLVTSNGRSAALIIGVPALPKPVFGSAKGKMEISDDFDAPLGDFEEYME